MFRILTLLCSALIAAPAFGELKVIESNDNPTFTTYQLTVTPAAEPDPVFKHRLVLQDIDLLEGNAASYYYRAMLNLRSRRIFINKEFGSEALNDWMSPEQTPLANLPVDDAKRALEILALQHELARATRTRVCDWGLDISSLRNDEYFSFSLEECDISRQEILKALLIRTRIELAEGNHSAALEMIRQNYEMNTDISRVSFLVSAVQGISFASLANLSVLEFVAQSETPNLYWALSQLPDPLIDFQQAYRKELETGWRVIPFLHDVDKVEHTPEEWNALWKSVGTSVVKDMLNDPPATLRSGEWGMTALGVAGYTHAKQQLIESGLEPSEVEKMAVGQVLGIYSSRVYQQQANLQERMLYTPWTESQRLIAEDETIRKSEAIWNNPNRELYPFASELLPSPHVRAYPERIRRQLAALRLIEALRMHAAENDGELPAALAEVSCVPVPDNPATGEPFVYQLDGDTAIIELPESDGLQISARYEIKIPKSQ